MLSALPLLLLCLIFALIRAQDNNQTRAICYSGSSLYQLTTQNCNEQDSSYIGVWYCAKMEICESFMSDKRQCVETRGCATEQECTSNGVPYSGQQVELSGQYPGGMKVTTTCCMANNFPDDDTVAIDFTDICNSASRQGMSGLLVIGLAALLTAWQVLM